MIPLLLVLMTFGITGKAQNNISRIYSPEEVRKMDAMQQLWDQLTNDTISYRVELRSLRLAQSTFNNTVASYKSTISKKDTELEESYVIIDSKNKRLQEKDVTIGKLQSRRNAAKIIVIGAAIGGFVCGVLISK